MENFNFNWSFVKKGAPFVTISKYGLAFNQICIDFLGKPDEIKIGFDKNQLALGIIATEQDAYDDSFVFKNKERLGWVRIGCKEFVSYLSKISGIDFLEKSKKYIPQLVEENKMIVVKLKEGELFDGDDSENEYS